MIKSECTKFLARTMKFYRNFKEVGFHFWGNIHRSTFSVFFWFLKSSNASKLLAPDILLLEASLCVVPETWLFDSSSNYQISEAVFPTISSIKTQGRVVCICFSSQISAYNESEIDVLFMSFPDLEWIQLCIITMYYVRPSKRRLSA